MLQLAWNRPSGGGFACGVIACIFVKGKFASNKTKGKELFRRNQISRPEPVVSFAQPICSSIKIRNIDGEEKELADAELSEVMNALKSGKKIEAIKLLRESTGLGLKEAKDIVEVMQKSNL